MEVPWEIGKLNCWLGSIVTPAPQSKASACTAANVDVQVVSISGTELAAFAVPKAEKVRTVKKVLQLSGRTRGRSLACHRLMMGSRFVSDDEPLASFPGPIVLTFVLLTFDSQKNDTLIHAAYRGDLAALENAVEGLADPNHRGEVGETSLHIVAAQGRLDAVTLLCEAGANPAATRVDGATPVFNASRGGHFAVVEHLLDLAPETVNAPRESGATPIFVAAQNGYPEVVRLLLERGGDPSKAWGGGATPLSVAAQYGHTEVVKHLCWFKVDLNTAMRDGATPLFLAAQNGHTATAAYLCGQGAAIDQPREDMSTPLFIACQKGHVPIIRLLCGAGASTAVARNGRFRPVHILAQRGDVRSLRVLVAAGVDVNAKMRDGAAALSLASQHGNTDAALFLLNAGADVDAARSDGATALFMATILGHVEVVHLLLNYGADREKATDKGTTPLQAAERGRDPQLTALLSGGGVLVDAKTGKTAAKPRAGSKPLAGLKPHVVRGARFLTRARLR